VSFFIGILSGIVVNLTILSNIIMSFIMLNVALLRCNAECWTVLSTTLPLLSVRPFLLQNDTYCRNKIIKEVDPIG
jgi:hypothetical protein